MSTSVNESEYNPAFIDFLEMSYGEGFLSAGGIDAVNLLFEDIDLNGKKILDIGCGIGGVDLYLASKYDCEITAIDVEPYVIEQANLNLKNRDLRGEVDFLLCEDLEGFVGEGYDVVFSKEVLLHIEDKTSLFTNIFEILKPGGRFVASDWLLPKHGMNKALQDLIDHDELVMYLNMESEYERFLKTAGFSELCMTDLSVKLGVEATLTAIQNLSEHELQIIEKHGQIYWDDAMLSWHKQLSVLEQGNLLVYLIKGKKV
jgi:2-polyprenyl-3-methyl-5-hydroxy-6-metoxy-1,4-benzoquinol methylase